MQTDVNKGRLPTMATCCLLQHTGHNRHQCMDNIQEDNRFTYLTASVLTSVVSRTDRSVSVVRQPADSSIYFIAFNHESPWQKSQLSSEICLQTQQNHRTVCYLQKTSLWAVYGERMQAVSGLVCALLMRDAVVRQMTLAAVLGIHSPTGTTVRPNEFLCLFFERQYKIRQSQIFGDFCYNRCSEETEQ